VARLPQMVHHLFFTILARLVAVLGVQTLAVTVQRVALVGVAGHPVALTARAARSQ